MIQSGNTLWLREADTTDLGTLAGWLSDPGINRWLFSQFRGKHVDERLLRPMVMGGKNRLYLGVLDQSPCVVVGFASIDKLDGSGAMWWALGDRSMRGRGLATFAVVEGLRIAFRELGLHSVTALVMEPNVPSLRVCEKSGFKRVGTLRQGFRLDNDFVDGYLFDAVHGDWQAP